MPKIIKEPAEVPVASKLMWSDADMVSLGIGSRTTIWRIRRSDPTFPRPSVRGKTLAEEVRAWLRKSSAAGGTLNARKAFARPDTADAA